MVLHPIACRPGQSRGKRPSQLPTLSGPFPAAPARPRTYGRSHPTSSGATSAWPCRNTCCTGTLSSMITVIDGAARLCGFRVPDVDGCRNPCKSGGAKKVGTSFANDSAGPCRRSLGSKRGRRGSPCQGRKPPEAVAEGQP
jgi:hypothetical protein